MRVETTIKLERHWTVEGRVSEDSMFFEVFVSADVQGEELGPVTVEDVPELEMSKKDRVFNFHPLRGWELTQAQEALWEAWQVLDEERDAREKRTAWEVLAQQRAVEAVVQATLARVKLTRINPKAFLAALAAELGAA